MQTEILFKDEDIIVVRKPAGIATQTSRVGSPDVVSELKNYLSKETGAKDPYLGIIHRLDQPVEGILVFALNKPAAAALSEELKNKDFHKHYYAVSYNQESAQVGKLEDYLVRDASGRSAQIVTANTPGAKKAVLRYREVAMCGRAAWYAVRIETGRFHQIRAQMAHAGMPILGDRKYEDEQSADFAKRMGVKHVSLCAFEVAFRHPTTGEKMSFTIMPSGEGFRMFTEGNDRNREVLEQDAKETAERDRQEE